MTSRETDLISYRVCGSKVVASSSGISSSGEPKLYSPRDTSRLSRLATMGKRLKSKCFKSLQKNDENCLTISQLVLSSMQKGTDSSTYQADSLESSFEEDEFTAYSAEAAAFAQFAAVDAIILASNELTKPSGSEASLEKHHKVRIWRNKREWTCERDPKERPSKRHHLRKWLNKSPKEVDLGFIHENRRRVFAVASEAAQMATIRNNARAAARAGAMAAARTIRMENIRSNARKAVEAGALATAQTAYLRIVRSRARKCMEIGALEAAKCAQAKLSEQCTTQGVHSTPDQELLEIKIETQRESRNISPVDSEDGIIINHREQFPNDDILEEDLEEEINSRIGQLYDQFEVVSPAFPELDPLKEGCEECSPIELQSEAKSEEDGWNSASPKDLTSAESLLTESFDRGPNRHDSGELAPVTEGGGDLENKFPSMSNVLGWFSKMANNDASAAAKNTEILNKDDSLECNTVGKANVWKCFGRPLGLFKEEGAVNSDVEVVSPFGDNQIGYAF